MRVGNKTNERITEKLSILSQFDDELAKFIKFVFYEFKEGETIFAQILDSNNNPISDISSILVDRPDEEKAKERLEKEKQEQSEREKQSGKEEAPKKENEKDTESGKEDNSKSEKEKLPGTEKENEAGKEAPTDEEKKPETEGNHVPEVEKEKDTDAKKEQMPNIEKEKGSEKEQDKTDKEKTPEAKKEEMPNKEKESETGKDVPKAEEKNPKVDEKQKPEIKKEKTPNKEKDSKIGKDKLPKIEEKILIIRKVKQNEKDKQNKTEKQKVELKFISGDGQTIQKGERKKLIFKVSAEMESFKNVYLDGKLVNKSMYSVTKGSTVITLNEDFSEKLLAGEHKLGFEFKEGMLATNVMVVDSKKSNTNETKAKENKKNDKLPSTGINGASALFLTGAISLAGVFESLKRRKK